MVSFSWLMPISISSNESEDREVVRVSFFPGWSRQDSALARMRVRVRDVRGHG